MSTLEGKTAYVMPRDASETERLNAQDKIWVTAIGDRINPEIARNLPENAQIADVGTGTGAWLIPLASNKSYQLDGLDISSVQFPTQHPDNVAFDTVDILKPVPEKYRARYDLIHLRLLMAGMKGDDDWKAAATHILDMLKPGGFVQWEEKDFEHMVVKTEPGAKSSALSKLLAEGIGRNIDAGVVTDVPVRLSSILKEVGFASSKHDIISSDRVPGLREGYTSVKMRALLGTARYFISQKAPGTMTTEELERTYEEALQEARGAQAYLQADIYSVTGRKAS